MVITIRKLGSYFYRSLSIFFEDRTKEYLLKKVKQFARLGFLRNFLPMVNNISIFMKMVWVSINYNERYIVDNKRVLKNYETFVF